MQEDRTVSDQSATPEGVDEADESAEVTQSATGTDVSSEEAPWGEEAHDPARAWNTILRLRDENKEYKSDAQLLKMLREDEAARQEFLSREFGYEFEDDDDPDLSEDTEQETRSDPRVEAHDAWITKQRAMQAQKDFDADLDKAVEELDVGVALTARERREIQRESVANGFNPESTRKALKELVEDRKELSRQILEGYRGSKEAPHVSAVGKGATQVPDLDDQQSRHAWLKEQVQKRTAD